MVSSETHKMLRFARTAHLSAGLNPKILFLREISQVSIDSLQRADVIFAFIFECSVVTKNNKSDILLQGEDTSCRVSRFDLKKKIIRSDSIRVRYVKVNSTNREVQSRYLNVLVFYAHEPQKHIVVTPNKLHEKRVEVYGWKSISGLFDPIHYQNIWL